MMNKKYYKMIYKLIIVKMQKNQKSLQILFKIKKVKKKIKL